MLDTLRVAWGAHALPFYSLVARLRSLGLPPGSAACVLHQLQVQPAHLAWGSSKCVGAWPAHPSCPRGRPPPRPGTRLVAVLLTALITPLHVLPLVPLLLLQVYSILMVSGEGRWRRGADGTVRAPAGVAPSGLAAVSLPWRRSCCCSRAHAVGCRPPAPGLPLLQVRSNASLCAAPLLSHPLTQQRLQSLYSWMGLLFAVLPGGPPAAAPDSGWHGLSVAWEPGSSARAGAASWLLPSPQARPLRPAPPAGGAGSALQMPGSAGSGNGGARGLDPAVARAQCEGALNFLAAVAGLLLPLLFLLKTEPAASLARFHAQCARRGAARAGGRSGTLGMLAAAWCKLEAGVEAALRGMAGPSWLAAEQPPPEPLFASEWERALAWALLLAVTWLWCTAPALTAASGAA